MGAKRSFHLSDTACNDKTIDLENRYRQEQDRLP